MEIIKLIIIIIMALGVTAIYDARKIARKYFGKQDQNTVTSIIKIIGFFVCALAGIVLLVQ